MESEYYLIKTRHRVHTPKTLLDILYTGEMAGNKDGIAYRDLDEISHEVDGQPFITLQNLIEYKLSSGMYGHNRYKDFDDIIELIKINKLTKGYANKFRKDLRNRYAELWISVQEEDK